MLNIVTLYRTSRGVFKTIEEASLKKNRAKVTPDYRTGNSESREKPVEIHAISDGERFFEISEIKVN